MSIKPILFNTDMVQAILDKRKTVTRRVVKPQLVCHGANITFTPHSNDFFISAEKGWIRCRECGNDPEYSKAGSSISHHWEPPYKQGDILYVREAWHEYTKRVGEGESCHLAKFYGYKASVKNSEDSNTPWKPSIHMPKEAARIWLKVTNVRVERLQDITGEQAVLEGTKEKFPPLAQDEFRDIWDSTVKKADVDQYGWKSNPWVWVIEFERCEKPEEVAHE